MADLVTYALTSVGDVKESLGISSGVTSKDNLIKRKINQATEMIESFCRLPYNHHFKQTTYTQEQFDGNGSNQLLLRARPATSVTSFQYRNTSENQDSWTDFDSQDYFLDEASGVIELLFGQNRAWNSYRVSYVAGYSTIPGDLAEACVTLATYLVENSSSGIAVKRKEEGNRSIEYFAPSQSSSLIESLGLDDILGRYINYTVADGK